MKNKECMIYMTTKHGSTQVYHRDKKGWIQKSSKDIIRRMTAEQLLSHLLPPLAAKKKSRVIIRVERRTKKGEI